MTTIPNHDTRVALREALEAVWGALDPSVDDINSVLSELEAKGYVLAERTRAAVTVPALWCDERDITRVRENEFIRAIGVEPSKTEKRGCALYAAPPLASAPDGGGWRTDAMPLDGTPIYIRTAQPYRFQPYKPNSQQAKRGEKGRWQAMNEYGGWDNCPHPLGDEWSRDPPPALAGKEGA